MKHSLVSATLPRTGVASSHPMPLVASATLNTGWPNSIASHLMKCGSTRASETHVSGWALFRPRIWGDLRGFSESVDLPHLSGRGSLTTWPNHNLGPLPKPVSKSLFITRLFLIERLLHN